MEKIVASRFRLIRKIGAGSFGQIYIGEDLQKHKTVAIKLESTNNKSPQLAYESKLYNVFEGCCCVPRIYFYGTDEPYNIMAIDLLGKSLEDHLNESRHRMSLKTVLMLCDQMISSVEYIHEKNYIHRDIKPDNFVMGTGANSNKVYIIDFGLSKRYRDQFTHQHIPWIDGKSLTGTARYASVNALRGIEQSRRDDMEALGYVWLYLLRGSLPWMGLKAKDQKGKYDKICEVKATTKVEELCASFPDEFVQYFREIKKLHFADTPNYARYREIFHSLFMRLGYVYDGVYDWTVKKTHAESSSRSSSTTNKEIVREMPNPLTKQIEKQIDYETKCETMQSIVNFLHEQQLDTSRRAQKITNESEMVKRYEPPIIKKHEARRIITKESNPNVVVKVETPRRVDNPLVSVQNHVAKPEKYIYGPPRILKYSQLPRWMDDEGNTIVRMRI